MNPDQKHMAQKNNSDDNDLNLVPFKTSMPSNMPVGWIPVFSFNKLNQSGPFTFPSSTFPNSYNNMTNGSSSGNNSNSNIENFPSDENSENLYSYNIQDNSSPSKNNTNTSNNTSTSNINRSENISEVLRNYTADLDENIDLCRKCLDKRIDKVYDKIQEKDPELIAMLVENYKIPCPIAKIIIRKIIQLSLKYCKKDGD